MCSVVDLVADTKHIPRPRSHWKISESDGLGRVISHHCGNAAPPRPQSCPVPLHVVLAQPLLGMRSSRIIASIARYTCMKRNQPELSVFITQFNDAEVADFQLHQSTLQS